eukprot:SM000014S00335  [mRNA]  locus=s14:784690:786521:- [translate_table: standard]
MGSVALVWVPLLPLFYFMYRQVSGRVSARKQKKQASKGVSFADVAGVDTAKAELSELVQCLRGAPKYKGLSAKLPRGVLLVGPPGTGKTMLARAVASEAGVPFFAASASEFVELFVGRGAARVRELFAMARKRTPSIVFIDELDAVGGKRGLSFNDERDQTLNQAKFRIFNLGLLTEMDGFEGDSGVLVLAATNRPEALDPALIRPGRLSRRVLVPVPDQRGREQILAVHARGLPVQGDSAALCRMVASVTPGFTGADLANVVNEAALLAARKERAAVQLEDFFEAVRRSRFGVGGQEGLVQGLSRGLAGWLGGLTGQSSSESPPPGYRALPTRS